MASQASVYGQPEQGRPDFAAPSHDGAAQAGYPRPSRPAQAEHPTQAWTDDWAIRQTFSAPAQANLAPMNSYHQPPSGATVGGGYAAMPGQPGALVQIGSIVVTPTEVITPAGTIPLSQAQFSFYDQSYTTRKTPTWAYVAAIVGFFVVTVFSLFFLLAKENVTVGNVMVGVRGPGLDYNEPIYVSSATQVQDAYARVQYANNLAAGAR